MAYILIIDDEQAHLDHAARILRGEGHEVQTALSGKEGLASIAARAPDLVFCDLNMPEVDGEQVLARLRGDPKTAGVPLVFLTAMRFKGARENAKSAGAQDYLVKPFDSRALLDLVQRLLGAEKK